MRTALILLLLLALAVGGRLADAADGPTRPERVVRYQLDHPLWGAFYDRRGLFDVFGSWWFVLDHGAAVRVARRVPGPAHPRDVARPSARSRSRRARSTRSVSTRSARCRRRPTRAIDGSRRVLRRRLFRVAQERRRPAALAAEKGALREIGSLLFHWAFLLMSSA